MTDINWPPTGKYILAVSGGVDSMLLLNLLSSGEFDHKYSLTVVHFDHAMRPDSTHDKDLVMETAKQNGLNFVAGKTQRVLKSEADARNARYDFLKQVMEAEHADGIITAHHQDDLIETSLLNLTRGTGRLGLVPFESTSVYRPLSTMSRSNIDKLANELDVVWRDDPTNYDISNPRNFLRHRLLAASDLAWRKSYLQAIARLKKINAAIDTDLKFLLNQSYQNSQYFLEKKLVSKYSQEELSEILLAAARQLEPDIEINRRLLRELTTFVKTAKPGQYRPLNSRLVIRVERSHIIIKRVE